MDRAVTGSVDFRLTLSLAHLIVTFSFYYRPEIWMSEEISHSSDLKNISGVFVIICDKCKKLTSLKIIVRTM